MYDGCAAESEMAGVFSFRALYQAYIACRAGKRGSRSAQRYDLRLHDNLIDTATALQRNAWRPSRSVCFVSRQAKPREVHAAEFSDRVVHHLLVPRLEALYEPVFIHDSYSNRVGKGTHAAVDRLQTFMRQVSGLAAAFPALRLSRPPRPGFTHTLSLPLARLAGLRAGLRRRRLAHVFIAEEGYLKRGLKRRVLRLAWRLALTPPPGLPLG